MSRPKNETVTETHSRIMDAALDKFTTVGFELSNLNDIAKMAGVSRQTIHSYYQSKKLLYEDVLKRQGRTLLDKYNTISVSTSAEETIRQVVSIVFDEMNSGAFLSVTDVAMREEMKIPDVSMQASRAYSDLVKQAIQQGKEMGTFDRDLDANKIQHIIFFLIYGFSSSHGLFEKLMNTKHPAADDFGEWKKYLGDTIIRVLRKSA